MENILKQCTPCSSRESSHSPPSRKRDNAEYSIFNTPPRKRRLPLHRDHKTSVKVPDPDYIEFTMLTPTALPPEKFYDGFYLFTDETVEIPPESRHNIRTGVSLFVHDKCMHHKIFHARIASKNSSTAVNGVIVLENLIPAECETEIELKLYNFNKFPITIESRQCMAHLFIIRADSPIAHILPCPEEDEKSKWIELSRLNFNYHAEWQSGYKYWFKTGEINWHKWQKPVTSMKENATETISSTVSEDNKPL